MPSLSLQHWLTARAAALDEIESAHQLIGGTGPGRRYATQQIDQAYAVLLASQFQGFGRDLHTESADYLARAVPNPALRGIIQIELRRQRKLDVGNPNPTNLGTDFNRLGLKFWTEVGASDARAAHRRLQLESLNTWRNAIAHQDFDPVKLGGRTTLLLQEVRAWRSACDGLARTFDAVLRHHLGTVTGSFPW
jgi:hypothetical protein